MAKEDVLAQFRLDMESAQNAAADRLYDTAFAEGKSSEPSSGTVVDGVDMGLPASEEAAARDKAVQDAIAAGNEQIAAFQQQIADLTQSKTDVEGKYAADEKIVQGFKGSLEKFKAFVADLEAATASAPTPEA